jgi:hypothetical protein
MILILILILILIFTAYFENKKKYNNIILDDKIHTPTPTINSKLFDIQEQESEDLINNIDKVELAVKYFLDNLDLKTDLWCFRIFKFFTELEDKISSDSDTEILIGYNSFKLPQNIINIIKTYPNLDLDIKKCGNQVKNEIKNIIINLVSQENLKEFMNSLEYLSLVYFKNDSTIAFDMCGENYIISNKLNNTLNYLKGDQEVSPILYNLSLKKQECMNLI